MSSYLCKDPKLAAQCEAHKKAGNEAFKAEDFHKAILNYNKAIDLDPLNPVFYSNRSAAFSKLGDSYNALVDAQKSIQLDKDYSKGYYREANAYKLMNDAKKAKHSYIEAIRHDTSNRQIKDELNELRISKIEQKMPAFGLPPITEINKGPTKILQPIDFRFNPVYIDQIPSSYETANAAKLAGNEYFRKGYYEKAIACYDKAISIKKDDPIFQLNKSMTYYKLGFYERAKICACEAMKNTETLQSDEFFSKALFRLGISEAKLGEIKEAVGHMEDSLSKHFVTSCLAEQLNLLIIDNISTRHHEVAKYYNKMAIDNFNELKFEKAVNYWTKALIFFPGNNVILSNRALGYIAIRQCNLALRDIDKAIKAEPSRNRIEKKAVAHYYLQQLRQAAVCFHEAQKYKTSEESILPEDFIERINFYRKNCGPTEKMVKWALCDDEVYAAMSNIDVIDCVTVLAKDPNSETAKKKMADNPNVANGIKLLREACLISGL